MITVRRSLWVCLLLFSSSLAQANFHFSDNFTNKDGIRDSWPAAIAYDAQNKIVYSIGNGGTDPDFHHGDFALNWLVRRSTDNGLTWEIVDSYQRMTGENSYPESIAVDNHGAVYVGGVAYANDGGHWIVRKSIDQGRTWSASDDFSLPGDKNTGIFALTAAADGTLVGAGARADARGNLHWVVRTSSDEGASWKIWDDFVSPLNCWPTAVAARSNSQQIAVGGKCVAGKSYWMVRQSRDGGRTWFESDRWPVLNGSQNVTGIGFADDKTIYVSGGINGDANTAQWIVRKSTDDGTTWTTVNTLKMAPNYLSDDFYPSSLLVAPGGRVYVAGSAVFQDPGVAYGKLHALVRASDDGGNTWLVVRDISVIPLGRASAVGLALGDRGDLWITSRISHDSVSHDLYSWTTERLDLSQLQSQAVDQFQLAAGDARATGLHTGKNGIIFGIGNEFKRFDHSRWIVRTSVANGKSWRDADTVDTPDRTTTASDMAEGPKGEIFVLGEDYQERQSDDGTFTFSGSCLIRVGSQDGKTWKALFSFDPGADSWCEARKIFADHKGRLYFFGHVVGYSSHRHENWFLKVSADHGKTWTTAVEQNLDIDHVSVVETNDGTVMYAANVNIGDDQSYVPTAEIFSSIDGGLKWQQIAANIPDSFNFFGMAIDRDGALYAGGLFYPDSGGFEHWQLYKGSPDGKSWIREFDYDTGGYNTLYGENHFVEDNVGNVFVTGQIPGPGAGAELVIKKRDVKTGQWNAYEKYEVSSHEDGTFSGATLLGDNILVSGSNFFEDGKHWLVMEATGGATDVATSSAKHLVGNRKPRATNGKRHAAPEPFGLHP